eukprot:GHVN01078566.1.p3 GENE.GHVN01078566.1~~GHVN01078566.1.p3  ORF type:complete len:146 (+),score=22.67 GHVN01078566.1:673-1110(+)
MAAKGAPMLASAKGAATAAKPVGEAVRDAVTAKDVVIAARRVEEVAVTAKDAVTVVRRAEGVAVTAKDAVTVGRRVVGVAVIARVVEVVARPVAGAATVIWVVRQEGAAHLEVAAQVADLVIAREPAVQRDAVPKVAYPSAFLLV